MDHTTALNLILANECSNPDVTSDYLRVFRLEGHCTSYIVKAHLVSTVGTIQYGITSVEVVD
jgi:hypothetical protein